MLGNKIEYIRHHNTRKYRVKCFVGRTTISIVAVIKDHISQSLDSSSLTLGLARDIHFVNGDISEDESWFSLSSSADVSTQCRTLWSSSRALT